MKATILTLSLVLSVSSALAAPESVQLYGEIRHESTGCDVGMLLTLDYEKSVATLEDNVVGFCSLSVERNLRTYPIQISRSASEILSIGSSDANQSAIEIRDHRMSVADVIYDALVEVTLKQGSETKLYSNP